MARGTVALRSQMSYRRPGSRAVSNLRRGWGPAVYNAYRAVRRAAPLVGAVAAPVIAAGVEYVRRKRARQSSSASSRKSNGKLGTLTRGTYHGRFRRPKRVRVTAFAKQAVSWTLEHGGTTSSSDTAYIGHGMAMDRVKYGICSAIMVKLYRKGGYTVSAISSRINGERVGTWPHGDFEMLIQYQSDVDKIIESVGFSFSRESTYDDATVALFNQLQTLVIAHPNLVILKFMLRHTVAGDSQSIAQLDAQNLMMHMWYSSSLAIQNQTLGSGASDDQITDITNNPLEGYHYEGRGNGFLFKLYTPTTTPTAGNNLVAANNTGVQGFNPATVNIPADMLAVYRRPPMASAFGGCTKRSHIKLAPGAIKKSYHSQTIKMSFARLFMILRTDWATSTNYQRVPLGKFHMLGLQKLCRTGAEQPVNLGFECNQTYKVACYEKFTNIPTSHLIL